MSIRHRVLEVDPRVAVLHLEPVLYPPLVVGSGFPLFRAVLRAYELEVDLLRPAPAFAEVSDDELEPGLLYDRLDVELYEAFRVQLVHLLWNGVVC